MSLNDLSDVIELEDSFHVLKLTETLKPEIKNLGDMSKQLLEELVEAEALALMQEDFLELESLVLAGVTLGELADTVESSIAVTGLQDSETIALANFNNYSSTDLFNTRVLPNKIEIFEGDDSYAFVMLTQKLEPAVQPFVDVAEIAIQEVRSERANEIIVNFSPDVEAILTGSKAMPELAGVSKETFKNVKRFSSLLPSEVISKTFESSVGSLVSSTAFNGDSYWAQSSNEAAPSPEDIGDSIEQYQGFYSEVLGRQFSGFIDQAFKKNQKVRLENFTSN